MKKTIETLALMINVAPAEIEKVLELKNFYRKITVPKRSGGKRILFIPPVELKKVQKKILRWFRKFSNFAYYGGVYGLDFGSPVDHLRGHLGHRWFLCFDLKDAFYSTDVLKVKNIIRSKLEEKKMSLEAWTKSHKLEMLCLFDPSEMRINSGDWNAGKLTDLIMEIVTYKGFLPQGVPTSPFLFKLSITEDTIKSSDPPKTKHGLFGLVHCAAFPWKVSCYVDNFVVSGLKPIPPDVKERIFSEIRSRGFVIHKVYSRDLRHGSPIICGLRISLTGKDYRIGLSKKTIRKWRGILGRIRFDCRLEFRRKVKGFLSSLKPIYGDKLPPQINNALENIRIIERW